MLSIGELARVTRVSVRMLRHYDALGIVRPVRVDGRTGYRWYSASQIGRVDALVALKELGFALAECKAILDDEVSAGEVLEMLRMRRAELAERIEADTRRLAEVGRRLTSIERGLTMTNATLVVKPLPAVRVAQVSDSVNDTSEIGAVVGPLFETLRQRLTAAGVRVQGKGMRTFYGLPDGSRIDVAAAYPLGEDELEVAGLEIVELPPVQAAAVVVHRGPSDGLADAWQAFAAATDALELTTYGLHRQVHLDKSGPDGDEVVELQAPVQPSGVAAPEVPPRAG